MNINKENCLTLLKHYFDKTFINELSKDYNILYENINKNNIKEFNSKYFNFQKDGLGNYGNRCSDISEINDYLNNLLYRPNIEILYIIISNYNFWKDKIFLDNGSGVNSFMSIFLNKIGIKCYNYDNFSQIGKIDSSIYENYYKKYNINFPYDDNSIKIEIKDNINCLLSSGIWCSNTTIINHKWDYFIIDKNYINKEESKIKNIINDFKIINHNQLLIGIKKGLR